MSAAFRQPNLITGLNADSSHGDTRQRAYVHAHDLYVVNVGHAGM